jgi:carboxymethylenebutenolidase
MIIRPNSYASCQGSNTTLDPAPIQKWAEESYAVVQITLDLETSADKNSALGLVERGIEALGSLKECDKKDNSAILGKSQCFDL